jgi:hypothetical protein
VKLKIMPAIIAGMMRGRWSLRRCVLRVGAQ